MTWKSLCDPLHRIYGLEFPSLPVIQPHEFLCCSLIAQVHPWAFRVLCPLPALLFLHQVSALLSHHSLQVLTQKSVSLGHFLRPTSLKVYHHPHHGTSHFPSSPYFSPEWLSLINILDISSRYHLSSPLKYTPRVQRFSFLLFTAVSSLPSKVSGIK